MDVADVPRASTAQAATLANVAGLLKTAFDGGDLTPLRADLIARLQSDPDDPTVLMGLSVVEQILGDPASGLKRQGCALARQRLYRSSWPASSGALRVLAFKTPGEIGANTPIEFLLQGADVVLYSLYVVPGQPLPCPLPDHDIAIVAAGESDQVRPVMAEIERWIPTWPCPVLNGPSQVLRLSREEMFRLLDGLPGLVIPPTIRVARGDLERMDCHGLAFPLIVRTVGSHAGRGLARLDNPLSARAYLAEHPAPEFFVSPYVDYGSPDGLFRKYRIVWVDGRPYPCHMAIASEWKVWYLNAGMASSRAKRAEEADFLQTFDCGFAHRHRAALAALIDRFDLEYAGIDCAELPDGRLLVFEGDIALVVHDMDPPNLYPYKGPPMRKLFAAFFEMLKRRSQTGGR